MEEIQKFDYNLARFRKGGEMRKIIFLVLIVCSLHALEDWEKEVLRIDSEIIRLTQEMSLQEKKALQAEVQSQGNMYANWSTFAQKQQEEAVAEDKVRQASEQIRLLKVKKQEIIDQHK